MSQRTAAVRRGFRKQVAVVALALAFGLGAAVPAPAPARSAEPAAYVAEIADLPLMAGLDEVPEAGVSFDKPSGRIVEAFAHGAVAAARVRRFYRETLPQLGWSRTGRDTFAREDESLEIDYLGRDGDLTVRYTLQPR